MHPRPLLGFTMQSMSTTSRTKFLELKAIRVIAAILFSRIRPLPAFDACQGDHCPYRFLCHFSSKRGRRGYKELSLAP
jgi:hypothetical protein